MYLVFLCEGKRTKGHSKDLVQESRRMALPFTEMRKTSVIVGLMGLIRLQF